MDTDGSFSGGNGHHRAAEAGQAWPRNGTPFPIRSTFFRIFLTETKPLLSLRLCSFRPVSSPPRTPSWTLGARKEPPFSGSTAASRRGTLRRACRGWRRAAFARSGTPRCRRVCPLCT
uniref:Uncharacterized protein n=1 Tax=Arundo donax TaxID=35708 RepID=A0A0A9A3F5_ARUDO